MSRIARPLPGIRLRQTSRPHPTVVPMRNPVVPAVLLTAVPAGQAAEFPVLHHPTILIVVLPRFLRLRPLPAPTQQLNLPPSPQRHPLPNIKARLQ